MFGRSFVGIEEGNNTGRNVQNVGHKHDYVAVPDREFDVLQGEKDAGETIESGEHQYVPSKFLISKQGMRYQQLG